MVKPHLIHKNSILDIFLFLFESYFLQSVKLKQFFFFDKKSPSVFE